MESKKIISALGYFLFFIPLIADSTNEDYRFHANQGLMLLIFSFIVSLLGSFIPVIGGLIAIIGSVVSFVFFILGVVNVYNGVQKELPIIAQFRLIK